MLLLEYLMRGGKLEVKKCLERVGERYGGEVIEFLLELQ
jgi:hypothetical protein